MPPAEDVIASLRRPASIGQVGGFRPPDDPITSWLGQVRVLRRDETWPAFDGEAMIGVCQVVVAELPVVPPALADVALTALFMRNDRGHPAPPVGSDDRGWVVRTYASVDELAIAGSTGPSALKPSPVRWSRISEDLPAWDDAVRVLDADELNAIGDRYHDLSAGPADGLKVGGWPSLVQSEIRWAPGNEHPARPDFVLQIDSDAKAGLAWGDAGVLYLGRGTVDPSVWAIEWQCL